MPNQHSHLKLEALTVNSSIVVVRWSPLDTVLFLEIIWMLAGAHWPALSLFLSFQYKIFMKKWFDIMKILDFICIYNYFRLIGLPIAVWSLHFGLISLFRDYFSLQPADWTIDLFCHKSCKVILMTNDTILVNIVAVFLKHPMQLSVLKCPDFFGKTWFA